LLDYGGMVLKYDSRNRDEVVSRSSLNDLTMPAASREGMQGSGTHYEAPSKASELLERSESLSESVQMRIRGAESNIRSTESDIRSSGVFESLLGTNASRRKDIGYARQYVDEQKAVLEKTEKITELLQESSKVIDAMFEQSKTLREDGNVEEATKLEKKAHKQLKALEEGLRDLEKALKDSGGTYAAALDGQRVSNQALLERFDTTITAMEVTTQAGVIALASAVTVSTGGVGGVALGALAGSGYSVFTNSAQAGLHVAYGNKTKEDALRDARSQVMEDARTSFITAASAGIGVGAGAAVRGLGAVQSLGATGTVLVGGSAGGAAGGVSGSVLGAGFSYADAVRDFEAQYGNLDGAERAQAWEKHKEQYRLDGKTLGRDIATSAVVGAVGGAIGGRAGVMRDGAKTFGQKAGIVGGELVADVGLGLGSAVIGAHLDGREVTQREVFNEISSAVRSSLVGGAKHGKSKGDKQRGKVTREQNPDGSTSGREALLSPEDQKFHDIYEKYPPIDKQRNAGSGASTSETPQNAVLVGVGKSPGSMEFGNAFDGDGYVPKDQIYHYSERNSNYAASNVSVLEAGGKDSKTVRKTEPGRNAAKKNRDTTGDDKENAGKNISENIDSDVPKSWVSGDDPLKHSNIVLEYISNIMGSPPVRIRGDNVPYNSLAFKFWRSKVSPEIPDTQFVLYFAKGDQIRQFVVSEEKRNPSLYQKGDVSEAIVKNATPPLDAGSTLGTCRFDKMVELADVLRHGDLRDSFDLHSNPRMFLMMKYSDIETGENGTRLLMLPGEYYATHQEGRSALIRTISQLDPDDIRFDYSLDGIGYLQLRYNADNPQSFGIARVNVTGSGSANELTKTGDVRTQAKKIIEYLCSAGSVLSPDTEVSMREYYDDKYTISTVGDLTY
jgi:hypothetical protein